MSINQTLRDLYRENWDELQGKLRVLDSNKYTNPFLISFNEEELNQADIKVMIFGQETKGWGDNKEEHGSLDTPEAVIDMYHKFFCNKEFYKGHKKSAFWKAFRGFQDGLETAHPEKSIYYSWNNINKIGRPNRKTGVDKEVRSVERATFSVIASELKAFEPDIVIFLTGPNRDGDIRHHFSGANFAAIDPNIQTRALAKVSHQDLPERTIRLYHPSYFGGFNKIKKQALTGIVN